jgi:hypothetical protein
VSDQTQIHDRLSYAPALSSSTTRVDLTAGPRKWKASGATAPVVHSAPMFASAVVLHRPRFAFSRVSSGPLKL